VSSRTAPYG